MSYQDKYSRWHSKNVKNIVKNPGAFGNGWIYTAYAKYLYPETLDMDKLKKCYDLCEKDNYPLRINRSPKNSKEPMSKDEIIGQVSLGLLSNKKLRRSHYNFCNLKTKFDRKLTPMNIAKASIALYKIRNEKRQYAWKNKMTETFVLLFALPPWDIYYVKKMHGVRPTRIEACAFRKNKKEVLKGNNGSTQMLLWLQLKDMKMSTKGIDLNKALKHDFRKSHPFYKKA